MGLAQLCGRADRVREAGQHPEQIAVGRRKGLGGEAVLAAHAVLGRVGRHRARPRVGVLDVEDRVVCGARGHHVQIELEGGVHRGPHERIPGGVHPDHLDQVLHRDHVPGPLGHAHRLAAAHEVDQLADEDVHVPPRAGRVAESTRHRVHAPDVSVMVGPQHVHAPVCPAGALVQIVGQVSREIGGLTVGLDDDPVLVVPEIRRAQPHRALPVEDHAALAQPLDGPGHGPRLVQGLLVEEHVEIGTELVQRGLDLLEHQLYAARAEDLPSLGLGQCARIRLARLNALVDHRPRNVLDVLAAVAVGRDLTAHRAGQKGIGEVVDLIAVIVEVVLAHHLGAREGQDPSQSVADGGPPGMPDVQRPGRIGRDVLQIHHAARLDGAAPVIRAGLHDRTRQFPRSGSRQTDVDEPRARRLGGGDRFMPGQASRQHPGQIARPDPRSLGQLHGDVRRPITMLPGTRTLHAHHRELPLNGQRAVRDGLGEYCGDQPTEFFRSHTPHPTRFGIRSVFGPCPCPAAGPPVP
jgi:hypothetical protein